MKILHVLDHSLPLHSGYSFRARNILHCQQQVGLEPVVVTSPKHEESWKGGSAAEEEIDGVRHYRSGRLEGGRLPFLAERRLMARLERRLREVARRERPDLLHPHSPVLDGLPALRVGRELKIPVVYEIRAFWEDAAVDLRHYREGGLKYRIVRGLETRTCRRADAVVPICRGLREDLLARGISGDRITVVPNAVNVDEFQPVPRDAELAARLGVEGALVVGFLGSFYHYEGLDLLLEAVAALAPEMPELKLLLVGGGAMEDSLKQQARTLGIEARVIFTGRLPHDQMPATYSLVDVLAFPRKSMRLTELVTPLKPLEAMAMGKVMVASDVGGHRELIRDGETGVLFRAGEVSSLAAALHRLLRSPDLRRQLGDAGRAWVRSERTWRANGEIYARLYESIRMKRGPGR